MSIRIALILTTGLLVSCSVHYTDVREFTKNENDAETVAKIEEVWTDLNSSSVKNAYGIVKKEGQPSIALYGMVVKENKKENRYTMIGIRKDTDPSNYEIQYGDLIHELGDINE